MRGTEQGLTDYRGTATLTFDQYRHYVQTEVFSALPDQVSTKALGTTLSLETPLLIHLQDSEDPFECLSMKVKDNIEQFQHPYP